MFFRAFAAGLFCMFAFSCNKAIPELFPENPDERPVTVYVVSHGWHVGIAVPVDSTFLEIMPVGLHARDKRYAEFGWGDRSYYMADDPGIWKTIKAAVWPTRSVLHVDGIRMGPEMYFSQLRRVKIGLSVSGYEELLREIEYHFSVDGEGQIIDLGPGLYGFSRFYASDRRYFATRNSNKWVARLLRKAGAPITPAYALTSGNVIRQSRQFGELREPD